MQERQKGEAEGRRFYPTIYLWKILFTQPTANIKKFIPPLKQFYL